VVGLLELASQLNPADGTLQRRCRRHREARLLIGFLLLLVPLQILVGWGELHRLHDATQRDGLAVGGRLRQVRRAILAAPSLEALEKDLQALQAPELPSEMLNQPLPELKRRLLATLSVVERRNSARAVASSSKGNPSTEALMRRVGQTCVLALIYAVSLLGSWPALRVGLLRDLWGFRWLSQKLGGHPHSQVDGEYFKTLSENNDSDHPQREEP